MSDYSLPGDGQAEFSHRDLTAEITDKSRNDYGWLVIRGTVSNPSNQWRRNVQPMVALYDKEGHIVDVQSGRTRPRDIPPGGKGEFVIGFPANSGAAVEARISVEAHDRGMQCVDRSGQ